MCISRVRVVYVLDKHVHGLNVLICSVLKSNFATVYVFDEKFYKKLPTGVFGGSWLSLGSGDIHDS